MEIYGALEEENYKWVEGDYLMCRPFFLFFKGVRINRGKWSTNRTWGKWRANELVLRALWLYHATLP
jgi:hypothetical protein